MYDFRNEIVGLGEKALVQFLEMRLKDMEIEREWRDGLRAFVVNEYENVKKNKSNYETVYLYLKNHEASELEFKMLDTTALVPLILYYPNSKGILEVTDDSAQLFKNQIMDIRLIRNRTTGHEPQTLLPEVQSKMNAFQLWAIGRITDFALLVMRYKGVTEKWKQLYHSAIAVEKKLQREHWLALDGIKNQAIPSETDISDVMFMAEQGDSGAQLIIGKAYYYGDRVSLDSEMAYAWIRKAARGGLPEAEYYLGLCYKNGCGIDSDDIKSKQWIKRAAEHDYPKAQAEYAESILIESNNLMRHSPTAANEIIYWAKLSAQKDCPEGYRLLGFCNQFGIGVEKDAEEGRKMTIKSAELGCIDAIQDLIRDAEERNDVDEAIKWAKLLEEHGGDAKQLICFERRKKLIQEGVITQGSKSKTLPVKSRHI